MATMWTMLILLEELCRVWHSLTTRSELSFHVRIHHTHLCTYSAFPGFLLRILLLLLWFAWTWSSVGGREKTMHCGPRHLSAIYNYLVLVPLLTCMCNIHRGQWKETVGCFSLSPLPVSLFNLSFPQGWFTTCDLCGCLVENRQQSVWDENRWAVVGWMPLGLKLAQQWWGSCWAGTSFVWILVVYTKTHGTDKHPYLKSCLISQ